MKNLRSIIGILLLGALCTNSALAQAVNATLLGTVTDASGAVVPSAKVTATETNTNTVRSTVTNESGNYSFPDLPPGRYIVTVEVTGFKKNTRSGIDVLVNTSPRVDMQLTPGNVTETVEVTAERRRAANGPCRHWREDGFRGQPPIPRSAPSGIIRILLNLVPGTTRASFQHSSFSTHRVRCKPKSTARCGWATTTRSKASTTTSGRACCRSWCRRSKPFRRWTSPPATTKRSWAAPSGAVTNVVLKSGTNDIPRRRLMSSCGTAISTRATSSILR